MSVSESPAAGDNPIPKYRVGLLGLIGATFFIVSGGPYGLEEMISSSGYNLTLAILIIMPFIWSLPTTLMVGELAAALPEKGGYFAWVKRGLGRFWGYQEAWLSFASSIFDMALYPTMFVEYLQRLFPALQGDKKSAVLLGLGLIVVCGLWNAWGAKAVGSASVAMAAVLLGPFIILVVYCFMQPHQAPPPQANVSHDLLGAIVIGMFNYAGWDNASTIAHDVDKPQRNYPLAMLGTVALVMTIYLVPVLALRYAGIDPSKWETGYWADLGGTLAGPWLQAALVIGGCVYCVGTYNALTMSYAHLIAAMAEENMLPRFLGKRSAKTDAPWAAVILCSIAYASCLGLGFKKLLLLDYMLCGLSIVLEFVALAALRIREPNLPRPFRISGGLPVIILLALGPAILTAVATLRSATEEDGLTTLLLGVGLVFVGPVLYLITARVAPSAKEP